MPSLLAATVALALAALLPASSSAASLRLAPDIPVAPQPLNYAMAIPEMVELAGELKREQTRVYDMVAGLKERRTFGNTIRPLTDIDGWVDTVATQVVFPKSVSPDKEVRAASLKLGDELNDFGVDLGARDDVYQAFLAYQRLGFPSEEAGLTAEERRVVERMARGFRREGMALPAEARGELKTMRKRLSKVDSDNQACLDNLETKFYLTDAELDGVPARFMVGRKKDAQGRLEVTLSGPDVSDVVRGEGGEGGEGLGKRIGDMGGRGEIESTRVWEDRERKYARERARESKRAHIPNTYL